MSKSVLLLQTLEMLRKRPGITMPELAAGLGRSQRTVYRYLSDLVSELKVQISCQDGTYRLAKSDGLVSLSSIALDEAAAAAGEKSAVKIRFSPCVASTIKQSFFHHSHKLEDLENGEAVLTVHAAGYEEMTRWILSFGEKAEVLEPQELRNKMRCAAAGILGLYESPAVTSPTSQDTLAEERSGSN